MIINVIKGEVYHVSSPEVCEVRALDERNGEYVLAFMQGGGQAIVQAVSDKLMVSSDHARVVQYHDQNTYEAHAGNAAIHLNAAERDSLYEQRLVSTPTGNSNANFYWFEVSGAWLSPGVLRSVMYKCRATLMDMTTEARFLGVWEQVEGGVFLKVGVSRNAVAQTVNGEPTWEFDGVSVSGAPLRFMLLANREDGWNTGSVIGARVSPTSDGSFLQSASRLLYIPQMTMDVRAVQEGRKLRADEAAFLEYLMANRAFPTT